MKPVQTKFNIKRENGLAIRIKELVHLVNGRQSTLQLDVRSLRRELDAMGAKAAPARFATKVLSAKHVPCCALPDECINKIYGRNLVFHLSDTL